MRPLSSGSKEDYETREEEEEEEDYEITNNNNNITTLNLWQYRLLIQAYGLSSAVTSQ